MSMSHGLSHASIPSSRLNYFRQGTQIPSSLQVCLDRSLEKKKVQGVLLIFYSIRSQVSFKFNVHENLVSNLWLLSILHLGSLLRLMIGRVSLDDSTMLTQSAAKAASRASQV